MQQDRIEWNRRYRQETFSARPAAIVRAHAHRAPVGMALDVACGNGRNACYLAFLGFAVDAVDIAAEGLNRFACRPRGIRRICADLDEFAVPQGRYSLIVNVRFLNRRILPDLEKGLAPGGMLIFENFLQTPARGTSRRHRPGHLLEPGELRRSFSTLDIVDYREHPDLQPETPPMKASLVALRPVAPSGPKA
ncbi:MAG: methyltransferase domain-containing protein [Desulfobacterales bacterium]|nr:methyltransferase domain-containing protein [Desulfobacterales bacterium]